MTSAEIQKKIEKIRDRNPGTIPESIRLQVESRTEHTLALLENALHTAEIATELRELRGVIFEFLAQARK